MSDLAMTAGLPQRPLSPAESHPQLWDAAQRLEASFLSEVLKSSGVSQVPSAFGGGPGEAQFASFLRDEQATAMVRAGGIGLAETLFEAMKGQTNG